MNATRIAELERELRITIAEGGDVTDISDELDRLRSIQTAARERPAEPGERCTCGRPAIKVYLGGAYGDTGYCGISDGGYGAGKTCPWCGARRHEGRCALYVLKPEGERPHRGPAQAGRPVSAGSDFESYIRRVSDEMVEALRDPQRDEAMLAEIKRRAAEQPMLATACQGCGSTVLYPADQDPWWGWCIGCRAD